MVPYFYYQMQSRYIATLTKGRNKYKIHKQYNHQREKDIDAKWEQLASKKYPEHVQIRDARINDTNTSNMTSHGHYFRQMTNAISGLRYTTKVYITIYFSSINYSHYPFPLFQHKLQINQKHMFLLLLYFLKILIFQKENAQGMPISYKKALDFEFLNQNLGWRTKKYLYIKFSTYLYDCILFYHTVKFQYICILLYHQLSVYHMCKHKFQFISRQQENNVAFLVI